MAKLEDGKDENSQPVETPYVKGACQTKFTEEENFVHKWDWGGEPEDEAFLRRVWEK